jgi:DNA-binding winged helix-turn-helix (wHTH) protein
MTFRFGTFELDEERWELRRNGRSVPVQRKALETMVFLIRRRERVVSRSELRSGVWPDTAVSDTAIGHAVMQARRALDDGDGRWIQTIRGMGLRFVGTVEVRSAEPAPSSEIGTAPAGRPRPEPSGPANDMDGPDSNSFEHDLRQALRMLFRTAMRVARSAYASRSLSEVLRASDASDDVLWELAARFRLAHDRAAARQTLEYLIERFPSSQLRREAEVMLGRGDCPGEASQAPTRDAAGTIVLDRSEPAVTGARRKAPSVPVG